MSPSVAGVTPGRVQSQLPCTATKPVTVPEMSFRCPSTFLCVLGDAHVGKLGLLKNTLTEK